MNEIARLIDRLELNQKEFAKRLGVSQQYVNKLVRGEVGVGTKILFKIAEEFPDVNLKYLIGAPNQPIRLTEEKVKQKETPQEDVRFEEIVAARVVETLKPYMRDFQEGHKFNWKQVNDLTDLVKVMAVRIDVMQDKLDEIQEHFAEDINSIKEAVKAE